MIVIEIGLKILEKFTGNKKEIGKQTLVYH